MTPSSDVHFTLGPVLSSHTEMAPTFGHPDNQQLPDSLGPPLPFRFWLGSEVRTLFPRPQGSLGLRFSGVASSQSTATGVLLWESPGSSVVRTEHFHCHVQGSIPAWQGN